MDPLEITRLAKHLRETGHKVLNSNFKLTLSGGFDAPTKYSISE